MKIAQFDKPHLSPDQILNKLERAGMVIDRTSALSYMHLVGGYRLKGYWFHLRNAETGSLLPGTSFADVIERYEFDRALRLITYQSLEQIEIAVRARIANFLSEKEGPHWFMNDALFKLEPDPEIPGGFLPNPVYEKVQREVTQANRRPYVKHYLDRYSQPPVPPSWTTSECLSFGTWSKAYSHLLNPIFRVEIAKFFNVESSDVFKSWLHAISVLRNTVAHHGRLWRMRADVEPMSYKRKGVIPNRSFFSLATVINYLLDNLDFPNNWAQRLKQTMAQYPGISPEDLGFSDDWQQSPGWVRSKNREVAAVQMQPAPSGGGRKERRRQASSGSPPSAMAEAFAAAKKA